MSNERITASKVNEKLIRLSSKVGLEPDISTRTGNGILGKVKDLFETSSRLRNRLEVLEQKEDKIYQKHKQEIQKVKQEIQKTLRLYWLFFFLSLSSLGFLGDKPFEILKFLFSYGLFP